MTKIIGVDNMTVEAVNNKLSKGAKFVVFPYCFSIVIMSFKRSSDIYFIKSGEGTFGKSLPFLLISLFLGWWGIPWGIIYTIQCLFDNLKGGRDVTEQVISALRQR